MAVALAKGFDDPVFEAQRAFRAVMDALARPGTIHPLPVGLEPPAPLTPEVAAIALALADQEAPLWLDAPLAAAEGVAAFLRFHTGAAIVAEPADAAFALVCDPLASPPLETFAQGTQEYPDRSASLVLGVSRLANAPGLRLAGPGILEHAMLDVAPLPPSFAAQWARNHALFPRGVDLVLAGPGCVGALPRTTELLGSA
jgi:alpha-D-ribose 1-methylphosphonate 5-triphosphate synthase subunit PhnH